MNPILVQGLLWLAFLICLYCLRNWHKRQADVTHKYKAIKFCLTVYGIYRMTYFLQEGIMARDVSIGLPSILNLVGLNVLLYVQVVRLLTRKRMQVITTIFSSQNNNIGFTILSQIIYLAIGLFIWIQGIEKAINYYQLNSVSFTVQELWGFVYASLYALFPVLILTLINYQMHHRKVHVVNILSLFILVFIFSLSAPGWLLIVQEKPILIFGMIVGFQEWLMYLLVKIKIQKEMRYFDVETTVDPTTIRVGSNEKNVKIGGS
ncbi:hypothetical protein FH002_12370 [Listeria monocytogenes]|nr:hypothetical protein [Listeria monocytogenes]